MPFAAQTQEDTVSMKPGLVLLKERANSSKLLDRQILSPQIPGYNSRAFK